ncbi:hypothetical protein JMN32_14995 [Fulvivirga sp. 29W222]|uniref:CHAT domain-containing protein n=1 Tax=Fulvivirga marina TaxID=2494733 RepID=A0A937G024_9BACT|nr:hypothetical protein [Fulvivirga marina]MBL6447623.1 hypothetical protein [Fulvivirga marina]
MRKKRSKYGVFIIESLRKDDYFDGENLSQILELSIIDNVYREVYSKEDFERALEEFQESKFRYLHFSCHADFEGFEINGDEITNLEISEMLKGKVKDKRVFLSACKGGNRNIATVAIANNDARSVIGTPIDLHFDKAALFWPAFYHVINMADKSKMNKRNLSHTLKKCVDLFHIPINYYHRINGKRKYLRRYKFRTGASTTNKRITVANKLYNT